MIKSKEVKLGNKIKVYDDIVEVTALDGDGIFDTTAYFDGQKGCCGYTEEMATGIALTPEILEKCGFDKQDRSFTDKSGNNCEVCIYLSQPFGDYKELKLQCKFFQDKSYTCMWWVNSQDGPTQSGSFYLTHQLAFLHQLQNLFFALAGEELNVQL